MFNMGVEVKDKGKTVVVTLNVQGGRESASGKSVVIASTEGNVSVPGTDLTLGLNLYRRK